LKICEYKVPRSVSGHRRESNGRMETGQVRNMYKMLVGKLEGKKPFATLQRRWEDITMHLKETERQDVN
jgi:hypothetical protein